MRITTYNAYIILDTRRAKADNTFPLKLRIIVERASFHIPLKVSIEQKYWKESKEQIATSCKSIPNVKKENIRLAKAKMDVLSVLDKLEDSEQLGLMTAKEIKIALIDAHSRVRKDVCLLEFGAEIIAELKSTGKVGNARVYQTMLNSMSLFLKAIDTPLQRLNYTWLKKYEAWYLRRKNPKGKPNSINGLSIHVRTLKALYNRAVKRSLIPREPYPFAQYTIRHEKTKKRAISEADIISISKAKPQTKRQQRAQDYFMMSYYLMGASFIDLAFLRKGSIVKDRIEYKRRKTGQLHSIKITPKLQKLLSKYLRKKAKQTNPYILDVIKGDTEEEKYTAARDEMRRYNKALKEIAGIAGIDANVTSYTARHSFATIAKYKGVPTAVISEALGHESEEITQVYLDSFDRSVLDKYNELVLSERKR